VRFTTARGQVVQFQAVQNSNPPHHRIGGSIRILYDPANPQQVKFDTWRNRWGEGFILISAGLGMVAVCAAVFMLVRSGRLELWFQRIVDRGASRYRWYRRPMLDQPLHTAFWRT
jgi:Protein of unknown function (DUF3592)